MVSNGAADGGTKTPRAEIEKQARHHHIPLPLPLPFQLDRICQPSPSSYLAHKCPALLPTCPSQASLLDHTATQQASMVSHGLVIFLVILGCAAVCLCAYALFTILFSKRHEPIDRSRPAAVQEEYMREVRQKNREKMWELSSHRVRYDPSYA